MRTLRPRFFLSATAMICLLTLSLLAQISRGAEPELPPVAEIPGLTVEDRFPRGCVDCHIDMTQINQDERLSSIMSAWTQQVPPEILEKARALAGAGAAIRGKHPLPEDMFQAIPESCLTCHETGSGSVVPLVPLIHLIHLSVRGDNHYLAIFQGHCTHCHKLDLSTGISHVPSAPEQ